MGYKQHNNPFSRKISSPLRHNVTNAAGQTWKHGHRDDGRTVSLEAKNITGSSKFGERPNRAAKSRETDSKRLSEERGGGRATEKNLAMDYAGQIADMYNRGELVGGQFIADDFYKRKSKLSLKNNRLKIKPRHKSIGDATRYNVQYADEMEGFDKEAGYQAAETQYTPEDIYDMMVQGGGMVSIVDGKIVAGNPNEVKYNLTDEDYENASISGTNRYTTSYQDAGYAPEGFTSDYDERSNKKLTVKELLEQRKNQKPVVVENFDDPNKKLTVRELLERRKQKSNSAINRVMGDSPLNQGHETDQRSDGPKEGFDYTPDEPVINTRTEEVLDDNGNVIGYRDITTTTTTNTGQREVPAVADTPDDGPDFEEDCKGIVMNVGNISRSGKFKCDLDPNPPPNTQVDPPEPTIETDTYDDVTEDVVFRPIETPPVEEPVIQRDRFNTDSASLTGKGLDLPLPRVPIGELLETAAGWFEPRSAGGGRGCGCMVNPR